MKFVLILLFTVFSLGAYTVDENVTISSFYVPDNEANNIPEIASKFDLYNRHKDGFIIYVPRNRLKEFYTLALDTELMEYDIYEEMDRLRFWRRYKEYHDFNEVRALLKELSENYGDIVDLIEYGKSKQGNPLYALKVSDNVKTDEKDEPDLLFTAALHGDEPITTEVLIKLLKELLEGYSKDSRLTAMVDNNEIYFILVTSPDGFIKRRRYANGKDPNREFPTPLNTVKEPIPCIKNLMNFYEKRNFKGSIDFHAFGQMIMFPWAYSYSRIKSDEDYNSMAKLVENMARENKYKHGQTSKTIYKAEGTSVDYFYIKSRAHALVIEIGKGKMPKPSYIQKYTDDLRESVWTFLEYF